MILLFNVYYYYTVHYYDNNKKNDKKKAITVPSQRAVNDVAKKYPHFLLKLLTIQQNYMGNQQHHNLYLLDNNQCLQMIAYLKCTHCTRR